MSTAALTPTPKMQFFDSNGVPLAGGKVYTYAAGTSSALATYTDSTETSQNTNPVILDSAGQANIWLGAAFYKIVVQDAGGVQISTTDNVSSTNLPFVTASTFLEGTPVNGPINSDVIMGSLALHRLVMSNNAGAPDAIVGQNTTDTLTNKTLTSPILQSPTADTLTVTGASTLAGSTAMSGPVTSTSTFAGHIVNGVPMAETFTGADWGEKVTAAIAALPSTGGTVDARGFGVTSQTLANPCAIGAGAKRVCLLVDGRTPVVINVTGGLDAITISDGSIVKADMQGGPASFTGGFRLGNAANIQSVFAPADRTGTSIFMLEGVTVLGNASATVTGALIDVQGVFTGSLLRDVTIYNPYNCIGLRILPGTVSQICSDLVLDNVQSNGGGVAGARPFVINGLGALSAVTGITILGGAFQHAGAGQYEIELDGLNAGGPGFRVFGIYFYGHHVETVAGGLSVKIADAKSIKFDGFSYSGLGSNNVFTISESAVSNTTGIAILASEASGAATNWIVDTTAAKIGSGTVLFTPFPEDYNHSRNLKMGGKLTAYNTLALAGAGLPGIVGQVALTGLTAAVGATTIYTPVVSGRFRLSVSLKVTTVAATSSTLGAVTITYTDPTDSVAQSQVMQMQTEAGAAATTNAGNTTAAKLSGTLEFDAKVGVAIQYAIAYASNVAATMTYKASLTLEAL